MGNGPSGMDGSWSIDSDFGGVSATFTPSGGGSNSSSSVGDFGSSFSSSSRSGDHVGVGSGIGRSGSSSSSGGIGSSSMNAFSGSNTISSSFISKMSASGDRVGVGCRSNGGSRSIASGAPQSVPSTDSKVSSTFGGKIITAQAPTLVPIVEALVLEDNLAKVMLVKEVTDADRKEANEHYSNADKLMIDSFIKVFDAVIGAGNPPRSFQDFKDAVETFIESARERCKGDDCIYDTQEFRDFKEQYYRDHGDHNVNSDSQAAHGDLAMSPEQYAYDRS